MVNESADVTHDIGSGVAPVAWTTKKLFGQRSGTPKTGGYVFGGATTRQ